MELGAAVVGQVVENVEGQFVAAVSDDGVELAQLNPHVEGEQVGTRNDGRRERGGAQDDDLGPVSVRGAESEWRLEFVVHLVDLLVQPLDVQHAMAPVLEPILADEEEAHLPREGPDGRPSGIVAHAQEVEDRPTRNDHRNDDNHVIEQNVLDARHVVHHGVQFRGLNFVLLEPSQLLNYDEQRTRPDVRECHERVEHHEDVEGLVLSVQCRPQALYAAPIQSHELAILLRQFKAPIQQITIVSIK